MGWKEVWEKYQIAVTFAEAGEHKMAQHFLQEGLDEPAAKAEEDHSARGREKEKRFHQAWKTGSAHGLGS